MLLGWCHYVKERPWRWAKTIFFLINMLLSLLLVCAPPLFIAILDVLVPSALLSSRAAPSLPPRPITSYHFHASLLDLPAISATRSLLILCVYVIFSGRGPYLAITTACSLLSAGYVAAKAATMMHGRWQVPAGERDGERVMEMLFLCSLAFAVAHIVVAYKTSCRERRKMIVYHIDIEAVSSTYHNEFPSYSKIGLSK